LGAVSAGIGPFFASIFYVIASFQDPSSKGLSEALILSALSTLLAVGLGTLVGIAIGLFRRAMVRNDRKTIE